MFELEMKQVLERIVKELTEDIGDIMKFDWQFPYPHCCVIEIPEAVKPVIFNAKLLEKFYAYQNECEVSVTHSNGYIIVTESLV